MTPHHSIIGPNTYLFVQLPRGHRLSRTSKREPNRRARFSQCSDIGERNPATTSPDYPGVDMDSRKYMRTIEKNFTVWIKADLRSTAFTVSSRPSKSLDIKSCFFFNFPVTGQQAVTNLALDMTSVTRGVTARRWSQEEHS